MQNVIKFSRLSRLCDACRQIGKCVAIWRWVSPKVDACRQMAMSVAVARYRRHKNLSTAMASPWREGCPTVQSCATGPIWNPTYFLPRLDDAAFSHLSPSEAFCTPVPYDLFLSNQPIPPYDIKPFHKPITVDAQQTHDVHTTLLKGWLHQKERCNIMQFSMTTLSYYVVVTYCTYYLSPRLNIFQSRNFYFLCFILLTSLGRQICQATVKYLFI